MPERAKVSSIEAIESFRANLIVYLEKARAALDDVSDEVSRTRAWLSDERRGYWENELRIRNRKLEEKQAALFTSRMATLKNVTQTELTAMTKAKRERDEALARIELIKKWTKQYDSRVQPVGKDIDKLRDILVKHMGQAVAYLARVTETLSAYADIAPPEYGATSAPVEGTAGETGEAKT
jgi:hypothetical protein